MDTLIFWRGLRKIGVLRATNLVARRNTPAGAVKIPIIRGMGIGNLRSTEPHFTALIEGLLNMRPGVFIDVGANVGQTLLKWWVAKRRNAAIGDYLGFEADPVVAGYTQGLIDINCIPDAQILGVGLSNCVGTATFTYNLAGDGTASIVNGFRKLPHARRKTIAVIPGDAITANLHEQSISVIKIDVEGGELEVLEGFCRTLVNCRPIVICEILPIYDESDKNGGARRKRTDGTLHLMRDNDYKFFRIEAGGTLTEIFEIASHGDLSLTNYLFAPQEWAEQIECLIPRHSKAGGYEASPA